MKKSFIAATLLASVSAFGYFNGNEEYHIISNPGYEQVTSYEYYKEGIKDTISQINNELSTGIENGSKVLGLDGKFLVLRDVTNSSLYEIIFLKSISSHVLSGLPIIIKNPDNRYFILYGSFSFENQADELIDKLRAYNAGAIKLKNTNLDYTHFNLLQKNIELNAIETIKNTPVKVVTIEKIRYIDGKEPLAQGQMIGLETGVNIKTQSITTSPKIKSKKTQQKKQPAKTTSKTKDTQADCLVSAIYNIKKYGLFNLETLQFKYNDQIYNKGDIFKHTNCSFELTKIYKKGTQFIVQFDDYSTKKLIARIKYPKEGFMSIDELFYNPDITANTKIASGTKSNSSVTKIKAPEKEAINVVQQAPAEQAKQSASRTSTINSSSALETMECNFEQLTGIRTQLIKKQDGTYKSEPVYDFYKNKHLKVDVHFEGNNAIVSAIGGQPMVIGKDKFLKNCK